MKHSINDYESGKYFRTEDYSDSKRIQKVVNVRYNHRCPLCDKDVQPGEKALSIKDLIPNNGWYRCWICLDCCDQWLEKTRQI